MSLDDSVILVPYYCYQCKQQVNSLSSNFKCSICKSDFLQEITPTSSGSLLRPFSSNHASTQDTTPNCLNHASTQDTAPNCLYLCSICLEENCFDDSTSQQLDCNHYFHKNCINPWLQSHDTCPLCRVRVKSNVTSTSPQLLPRVTIQQIVFSPPSHRRSQPVIRFDEFRRAVMQRAGRRHTRRDFIELIHRNN